MISALSTFLLVLIPHPLQAGEDPGCIAPTRPGSRRTLEVPAEVLVGVGGAVARAVGCLDGGEGLVDLLLGDTLYLGSDGGDGRRLGREVAHDGKDGGCGILFLLPEDICTLLAHENHRSRERPEDRHCIVCVTQEKAALLELE